MVYFSMSLMGFSVVMWISVLTVGKLVQSRTRSMWIILGCSFIVAFFGFWLLRHFVLDPYWISQCAPGNIASIAMGCSK